MVKLDLTSLQNIEGANASTEGTSVTSESVSEVTNIIQETSEVDSSSQDSTFSFSLSSLIWGKEPEQKIELINNNLPEEQLIEIVSQDIKPEIMINSESEININEVTGVNDTSSEVGQTILIDDTSTDDSAQNKIENTPIKEEKVEFFKNFDVIKEFSEEKWDELVIWKGEEKKIEELQNTSGGLSILEAASESIPEVTEVISEQSVVVSEPEESIISGESILAPEEPATSIISNDIVTTVDTIETSPITQAESINIIDNAEDKIDSSVTNTENQPNIEQVKKDLSSVRKPFWIKAFNKKSVIASVGALFLVWALAFFWLNQVMDSGKINVHELNKTKNVVLSNNSNKMPVIDKVPENNSPELVSTEENSWSSVDIETWATMAITTTDDTLSNSGAELTKYIEWTDYVVIKNTRKNIKKSTISSNANSPLPQSNSWVTNTGNNSTQDITASWLETNNSMDEMSEIANEVQ